MPSDHRLHPSSILFALGGSLRAFALPAIFLLITSGRSSRRSDSDGGPAEWVNRWIPGDFELANWQFWILLFLVPATLGALAKYVSFRLRYDGTELVIRSGIIFRNERHVPYRRIQNLDAVRNIVHRLFGVAEVRVETGGGQAPEATISVLHETVFEEMRRRIFEGRGADPGAFETHPDAPSREGPRPEHGGQTLLHLPTRELLLNGLLENRGLVIVGAAYGALWETGLLDAVWEWQTSGWYTPGLLRDTARTIAAGNLPSLGRIAILLSAAVGLLLLVRVLSVVWSFLRLHQFRLARVGDDVRSEYGLLTRVTTTVPLRRVQSLMVTESPLQRLVGRMSVHAETAGGHGEAKAGDKKPFRERLAPIIRRDAVPALLQQVLPGLDPALFDWQPLHPRAFRRAVKPALLSSAVIGLPLVFWFRWSGLAPLAIVAAMFVTLAWAHVRHTQWAMTDHALALRTGWLWREMTIVPAGRIQVVRRVESPFDRRAAMAGVRVDTAGSSVPTHRIAIPYLDHATAEVLYARLVAQTAQTALRW